MESRNSIDRLLEECFDKKLPLPDSSTSPIKADDALVPPDPSPLSLTPSVGPVPPIPSSVSSDEQSGHKRCGRKPMFAYLPEKERKVMYKAVRAEKNR